MRRNLVLCGCLVLGFLISGCVPTKYVERKQYLFNVPIKQSEQATVYTRKVLVRSTNIIVPYDQLFFLYRISDTQYVTDFYNGFLASPAQQFNNLLINYLRVHANFYPVAENGDDTAYFLNTEMTEIYADYRDRNNPQAVMSIRFTLSHKKDDKLQIVFTKTFRAATSLTNKDTTSLMAGWNKDLLLILQKANLGLNDIKIE